MWQRDSRCFWIVPEKDAWPVAWFFCPKHTAWNQSEEASDRPKLKGMLRNKWPPLFETKALRNRVRNCSRLKTKEIQQNTGNQNCILLLWKLVRQLINLKYTEKREELRQISNFLKVWINFLKKLSKTCSTQSFSITNSTKRNTTYSGGATVKQKETTRNGQPSMGHMELIF